MANKGRSVGRIISAALIVVGVALVAIAGGIWLYNQYRYHQQDVETEKLATYVTLPDDDAGTDHEDDAATSQAPQVDWAGLKAINDDVVAWLEIPGTVISYPVYQTEDNEYYLHHNAEGATTVGGQVFLDALNTVPGMQDHQSILYGHHLRNGAMFQPVASMDNQATFDATTTVWYVTEDAAYELEPLLLYYATPDDTTVRNFVLESDDAFRSYLMDKLAIARTSRSDAAEIIAGTSHVLTLSTCNYYDGYGRTELVCVPKDEAAAALAASTRG